MPNTILKMSKKKSELKISAHKRHELNINVDMIISVANKQKCTTSELLSCYKSIQMLLKRSVDIESVLKIKTGFKDRKSKIEEFTKWTHENGGKFDGVMISEFAGYGLGLLATKPHKKDQIIIEIPNKIMLCDATCMTEEIKDFIEELSLLELMNNVRLAFFVLYLKLTQGFWKPYMDILPEKHTTALYFTEEEILELKGTSAFDTALTMCISIGRQYAVLYNHIKARQGNKVADFLKEKFTYELYR